MFAGGSGGGGDDTISADLGVDAVNDVCEGGTVVFDVFGGASGYCVDVDEGGSVTGLLKAPAAEEDAAR